MYVLRVLRDVEGEGHCRAQQYDIAPEGQEAPVGSLEIAIYGSKNFDVW